jgi:hypothetical protein
VRVLTIAPRVRRQVLANAIQGNAVAVITAHWASRAMGHVRIALNLARLVTLRVQANVTNAVTIITS